MPTIITCGFQSVHLTIFRQKSLNKGKKLLESFHVSDVKELKEKHFSKLSGVVLRETPGAQSSKTNTDLYNPSIEVIILLHN